MLRFGTIESRVGGPADSAGRALGEVVAADLVSALTVLAMLAAAAVAALLIHAAAFALAGKAARRTPYRGDEILVDRLRGPSRVVVAAMAVQFVMPAAVLPDEVRLPLRHGLSLVLILAVTWMAIRLVGVGVQLAIARYDVSVDDNLAARRVHTQFRVLARVLVVVIGIVGVGVALTTFPAIRQLGASILASAGIAGIILGLASQKVLGNFIAGLQIAFTGSIHLDDVVVIEGEWGRVEEITTTYVVVRIWDERRLIVPFSRITDQPFVNWTRRESRVLGTVFVYTDYSVPVDAVRNKLREIVEASPHWDQRAWGLAVTDAKPDSLELRALVSARDGSRAWDLRCEVREKLVAWLQREHPAALPRSRIELDGALRSPDRAAEREGARESSRPARGS